MSLTPIERLLKMPSPEAEKLTLGALLKRAREESGLTQGELAKRLGVAVSTVCRWEQDQVEPRGPRQKREIASAFATLGTQTSASLLGKLGVAAGVVTGVAALGAAAFPVLGGAMVAGAAAQGVYEIIRARRQKLDSIVVQVARDVGWDGLELRRSLAEVLRRASEAGMKDDDIIRALRELGGE